MSYQLVNKTSDVHVAKSTIVISIKRQKSTTTANVAENSSLVPVLIMRKPMSVKLVKAGMRKRPCIACDELIISGDAFYEERTPVGNVVRFSFYHVECWERTNGQC